VRRRSEIANSAAPRTAPTTRKTSRVTSFMKATLMSWGGHAARTTRRRVAALAQGRAKPPARVHGPLLMTVVARHSGTSLRRPGWPRVVRATVRSSGAPIPWRILSTHEHEGSGATQEATTSQVLALLVHDLRSRRGLVHGRLVRARSP
jgi:hypothetical protein